MWEHGTKGRCKVLGFTLGKTRNSTRVNTLQIRNRVMVSTHGPMGVCIEDSGKTVNSTDLASIQLLSVTRMMDLSRNRFDTVCGLTVRDSAGFLHPKRQICISSSMRLKNQYLLSKSKKCSDDL